jgi:hypothetical protein
MTHKKALHMTLVLFANSNLTKILDAIENGLAPLARSEEIYSWEIRDNARNRLRKGGL